MCEVKCLGSECSRTCSSTHNFGTAKRVCVLRCMIASRHHAHSCCNSTCRDGLCKQAYTHTLNSQCLLLCVCRYAGQLHVTLIATGFPDNFEENLLSMSFSKAGRQQVGSGSSQQAAATQ